MNKQQAALTRFAGSLKYPSFTVLGVELAEVREWVEGQRDGLPVGPSDTDIGVQPLAGKKWSVREKVEFAGVLEELLAVSRVDLVCLSEADPFVAAEIIRGKGFSPPTDTQRMNTSFISFAGPGIWPLGKGTNGFGPGRARMTPMAISKRWWRTAGFDRFFPAEIRSLPLENPSGFFADRRNIWSAESCLRRSLEALFDVGAISLLRDSVQESVNTKKSPFG